MLAAIRNACCWLARAIAHDISYPNSEALAIAYGLN